MHVRENPDLYNITSKSYITMQRPSIETLAEIADNMSVAWHGYHEELRSQK